MKFQNSLLLMLVGGIIIACQPAIQPMPEAQFRAMMDYEIAQDISKNCDDLSINLTKSDASLHLENHLSQSNLSVDEILQLKQRARAGWGEKYKLAYANVIPIDQEDPQFWCNYGQFEMDRRSAIGHLLTSA